MEGILIGKLFKRDSKSRVNLRLLGQERPFVSMDLEELDEFMEENRNSIVFMVNHPDRWSRKDYIVDEGFLSNFLMIPRAPGGTVSVNEHMRRLSDLPKSLVSICNSLELERWLKLFFPICLKTSAPVAPWEEFVCSSIKHISRRDRASQRIDIQKATRLVFGEGGLLEDLLPDYEYRQEQFMASLEIAESIENDSGLMIEAGTGTGKSIAYLAPLAYACVSTKNQAVVSTRTRILQDQLIKKDIPIIKKLPNLKDLRTSSLKGRERYLCVRKLYDNLQMSLNGFTTEAATKEIFGVLLWSMLTEDGDIDSISLADSARRSLTGNRFDCTRRLCQYYEICPYYINRENSRNSDLVVTNHTLLFNEANIRIMDGGENEGSEDLGTLLPVFKYLVIDEAHELENSLTQAMSYIIDPVELVIAVKKCIKNSRDSFGLLKRHFNEDFLRKLWERMNAATVRLEGLIRQLTGLISQPRTGERRKFASGELETLMDTLRNINDCLQVHLATANQTEQMLQDIEGDRKGRIESLESNMSITLAELREYAKQLAGLTSSQDTRVIFAEKTERSGRIVSSPVENDRLMSSIFPDVKVKIFISATLWVHSKGSDGFNYARRILGAKEDFASVRLGTSFDYTEQLRFFVPMDMPDYSPDSLSYIEKASEIIGEVLSVVRGGSMVLFTSYNDLKKTLNNVTSSRRDLVLNFQERYSSPITLLSEHVNSESSTLFGARAFWEGVDLPGEQLKLLIVYKLPFDRPDDPVIESRIRHYGKRSFVEGMNKYYYPKMITSFRQGIGRLIRTRRDRGVVIVLDRRIVDPVRAYSRKLLASLTPGIKVESVKSTQVLTEIRKLKRSNWF